MESKMNRRHFLRAAALAGAGTALAACAAPAPQVVEKVVTQVVEKSVEKQVVQTQIVEKQVTQVVEKMITATPPPAKVINLRFSSVGWGGWLSEPWKAIIKKFNESQKAIQIPKGYEDVAEGYQKVMAQAAGTVAADIYMFENKFMQSFGALGFFVPLDDLVKMSTIIKKEKYFASDWDESFFKGKQLLVPFDNSPSVIWYNKDIFEKAGVAYPPKKVGDWDWVQFLETSRKLTKGEGAQKVYGWGGERGWVYSLPWIWSNGGWFLNENKTKCVVDSPEATEGLKWAADLIIKEKVQPMAAEMIQGGTSAMFYANRAAMAQKGTWWAIDLKAQKGLRWNVAPMPKGKAGSFARNPCDAWGIWTGSPNKEAAWKFIEFLSTDESLTTLTNVGLSVSNKQIMANVFAKQEPKDVDWTVFSDMLDGHVRQHPDTAIFQQMNDMVVPLWDKVLEGKMTVAEYTKTVADNTNKLLKGCQDQGECPTT
jgi:multiple sugar transport system substrate-binding protein